MVKAIFIDYTGTMVREDDPYSKELIGYILKNSDFKSPADLLKTVWEQIKSAEAESVGVKFIKNIEKINKVIDYCKKNYGLKADENYIRDLWQKVWIKAPIYEKRISKRNKRINERKKLKSNRNNISRYGKGM